MVTEETLASWYDPTKKGIIIVGMMRSGTQRLTDVVNSVFCAAGIDVIYNGEIPGCAPDIIDNLPLAEAINLFLKFVKIPKYTISSIVMPQVVTTLFGNNKIYNVISRDYTIIKLTRKNILEHLRSLNIFSKTTQHSCITPDIQLSNLFPCKFTISDLAQYTTIKQYISLLPADESINYEDFAFVKEHYLAHRIQNDYGIDIKNSFNDIDSINNFVENLKIY